MLMVPPAVRVYVCAVPADTRRSFDGLAAMTEQIVKQDPLSGHLFVFCNKAADRVKVRKRLVNHRIDTRKRTKWRWEFSS